MHFTFWLLTETLFVTWFAVKYVLDFIQTFSYLKDGWVENRAVWARQSCSCLSCLRQLCFFLPAANWSDTAPWLPLRSWITRFWVHPMHHRAHKQNSKQSSRKMRMAKPYELHLVKSRLWEIQTDTLAVLLLSLFDPRQKLVIACHNLSTSGLYYESHQNSWRVSQVFEFQMSQFAVLLEFGLGKMVLLKGLPTPKICGRPNAFLQIPFHCKDEQSGLMWDPTRHNTTKNNTTIQLIDCRDLQSSYLFDSFVVLAVFKAASCGVVDSRQQVVALWSGQRKDSSRMAQSKSSSCSLQPSKSCAVTVQGLAKQVLLYV